MSDRQVWVCRACDVEIPVESEDPYYPAAVYCPECGEKCDLRDP